MAYGAFDKTKPAGTDLASAFPGNINTNEVALRDMAAMGQAAGYDYSVSGGTAEEPATLFFKQGTGGSAHWLRATLSWSSGRITQIVWDKSINGGTDYTTAPGGSICTQVFSYDGSGNLTTATNAGGVVSLLIYLLGKVKSVFSTLTTHTGTTGTGVHGLGTMSTQAASAVNITGGTVQVTWVSYNFSRGGLVNLGNFSGTVNLDWSAGDTFYGTCVGVTTFTESNRPSGLAGSITLDLTNPGAFAVTWPAAWKWPAGVAPTRTASGVDLYEAFCRDGTTVHAAQSQKDSR